MATRETLIRRGSVEPHWPHSWLPSESYVQWLLPLAVRFERLNAFCDNRYQQKVLISHFILFITLLTLYLNRKQFVPILWSVVVGCVSDKSSASGPGKDQPSLEFHRFCSSIFGYFRQPFANIEIGARHFWYRQRFKRKHCKCNS